MWKQRVRKSLQKAGGCMNNKVSGFMMIESLIYICIVSILITCEMSLVKDMYKSYIELSRINVKYNNLQNFYLNLKNICTEPGLNNISIGGDDSLYFERKPGEGITKRIKSYDGCINVRYISSGGNVNVMLRNIDNMKVDEKGNLIYITIKDDEGKEFVRCIPKGMEMLS